MHASELLTYLWVGVVVCAVIGNIVKTARRAARSAPTRRWASGPSMQTPVAPAYAPPVTLGHPPPPPPTSTVPRRIVAFARQAPLLPPVVPPAPKPGPPSAPVMPAMRPVPRVRRARWASGRGALVRAVIAAEVLGKPRALRDEW